MQQTQTEPKETKRQTTETEFLACVLEQMRCLDMLGEDSFLHPTLPARLKIACTGSQISVSLTMSLEKEMPAWIGELARFAEPGEPFPVLSRKFSRSRLQTEAGRKRIENDIHRLMLQPMEPLIERALAAYCRFQGRQEQVRTLITALGFNLTSGLPPHEFDASACLHGSPMFDQAQLIINTQTGNAKLLIERIPPATLSDVVVSLKAGRHSESLSKTHDRNV